MAETPEGKVKRWLRTKMKEKYPEALHYAPPGGFFGQAGIPDDMWVIGAGKFDVALFIESKAEGGTPTPLQWKKLYKLKVNGAVVATMIGRDEARLKNIFQVVDDKIEFLKRVSDEFRSE